MVVFAPVVHFLPPSKSLTVGCAVVVDLGLERSGMLLFLCVFSLYTSRGLRESLAAPISSPCLLALLET